MQARRVWQVVGVVIGVVLVACTLVGVGGYWLLDAAFNPRPHADTRLRAYLVAVQAEDWPTAADQVDYPTGTDAAGQLRAQWATCTAARGRIVAFSVSTRPLDFGHATAAITFADGTRDRWSVYMNPKRGPGWKLLGQVLPPACHGAPPDAGLSPRGPDDPGA